MALNTPGQEAVGGGIDNGDSFLAVSRCAFSGNSAAYGGGIGGGTNTVRDSSFSGNTAEHGGGIGAGFIAALTALGRALLIIADSPCPPGGVMLR
jgi:hypothetical protein